MKKTKSSTYLDDDLNTAIQKECARTNQSVSDVLRRIVAQHFGLPEPPSRAVNVDISSVWNPKVR